MPWRGPQLPGEFPTLGYQVAELIEAKCVIPDGDNVGKPFVLTDEQLRFLLFHYRLDPETGAFTYRRSQLVAPQKWGKGPFAASIVCAECDPEGPVLFDGWDANGEPVGRPWETPWWQITAVSEGQTDNTWRALVPMIELGSLAADIPDTGQTRINLRGGGRIEPVTASARSRLGQRITGAIQDETHSWLQTNGGIALADTQRRNLAGMKGRSIETTNAWNPAEESVARLTYESPVQDIYRHYPKPLPGNFANKRERRKILRDAYKGCWWIDLDRIDAECEELLLRDPSQAERFFGNRLVSFSDAWVDIQKWHPLATSDVEVAAGTPITMGFDGALFDDATALLGATIDKPFVFVIDIWENVERQTDWETPKLEVDARVHQAFEKWDVQRFYADPPYWQDYLDKWHAEFGDAVVEWWTNRDRAVAAALERFHTAIVTGELSHDGNAQLAKHIGNAHREERRSGILVRKDRPGSMNKIDALMAATLAWEARSDVIASGVKKKRYRAGGF